MSLLLGQRCRPTAPGSACPCPQSTGPAVTSMAVPGAGAAGAELDRGWFWSVLRFPQSHCCGSVQREKSEVKGSEHAGEGAAPGMCFTQGTGNAGTATPLLPVPLSPQTLRCCQSLQPVACSHGDPAGHGAVWPLRAELCPGGACWHGPGAGQPGRFRARGFWGGGPNPAESVSSPGVPVGRSQPRVSQSGALN